MPDFLIEFFKFMQKPDILALQTVAGLAAFLKLILIPGIKWLALKMNKPMSGTATVVTVFISSVIVAEVAGYLGIGLFTVTLAVQMLGVSVMASLAALGMQSTATAVVRSKES